MNNQDPFADLLYSGTTQSNRPVEDEFNDLIYKEDEKIKSRFKPGLTHKPKTKIEDIPRQVAQFGSRAVEAVASIPRQLAELGISQRPGLDDDMYTAPGRRLPKERAEDAAKEQSILSNIGIKNPEELKEFSEKITGGYTKPQSGQEEFVGNVVGDVTSLLVPIKGKLPFSKSVVSSLAGNSMKEIVGAFGGGETAQNLSKATAMVVGGAINPGGAKKYYKDQYALRDSLLPSGQKTDAFQLNHKLLPIQRKLLHGAGKASAEKAPVLEMIELIQDKSKSGDILVRDLIEFKKDIYSKMSNYDTVKGAKNELKVVNKFIDETIENYGKYNNPEFLQAHKNADAAFSGIQQSKKLTKGLEGLIKGHKKLSSLGIGGTYVAAQFGLLSPALIAKAAAAYPVVKLGELVHRSMRRDPTLRNYYLNLLAESAKGNSVAASKILTKFNQRLEKKEKSESKNHPHHPSLE